MEQKSQMGPIRGLSYQILSVNRDPIAAVFPKMWKQLLETDDDVFLPTMAETRIAFREIAARAADVGAFSLFWTN